MNPTTYAEHRGDEVWIYVRGQLVMKRWLKSAVSAVFHTAPAGSRWSSGPSQPEPDLGQYVRAGPDRRTARR